MSRKASHVKRAKGGSGLLHSTIYIYVSNGRKHNINVIKNGLRKTKLCQEI